MHPTVSVIMPVYNGEQYLKDAIDSVLSQTFNDFELLIIDDASKDNSVKIVKQYSDKRIKLFINETNQGVALTLNKGIELSVGRYIARMDCDDISEPDRFIKQVSYMDKHDNCVICGSSITVLNGSDERLRVYSDTDGAIRADMIFNSAFVHPAVMMRADVLKKFSIRYNVEFERAEDYEMWSRILKKGKCCNLKEPLLKYRHHERQITQIQNDLKNEATNKVRSKILDDMKAELTEKEKKIFFNVCNGKRELTSDEYADFVSGGKKIVSAMGDGKKELRRIYSGINVNIKLRSGIKNTVFFSAKEPLSMLLCVLKKMFEFVLL